MTKFTGQSKTLAMASEFSVLKEAPKQNYVKTDLTKKTSEALAGRSLFVKLNFDKLGISLSFLCAIHCIVTPFIMLSIPIMARYYLAHPMFHWALAFFILPVGAIAFYNGYKHHKRALVWWLGLPGLFIVSFVPIFLHDYLNWITEPILMLVGSGLVVSAHYLNRRSCACDIHRP